MCEGLIESVSLSVSVGKGDSEARATARKVVMCI